MGDKLVQRLHISEAVRIYNKTRQTFYNRVKKGYVRTKKAHNKVYISTEDIERMLSEYLDNEETEEQNTNEESNTSSSDSDIVAYEFRSGLEEKEQILLEKINHVQQTVNQSLQETKQELRTDIQRTYHGLTEEQQSVHDTVVTRMQALELQALHSLQTLQKKQKKTSFRVGYMLFVLINLAVLGRLLP